MAHVSTRSDDRRFLWEAAVLGLVLILWAGASSYLRSSTGRLAFVRQETTVDLRTRALPPARLEAETLRVPKAGQPAQSIRFRPLKLKAGTKYVLVGTVGRGTGFQLSGLDRKTDQRVRAAVSGRLEEERFLRFFTLEEPVEKLRFRLKLKRPAGLAFRQLALAEFSPVHARLLGALNWPAILALLVFIARHGRRLLHGLSRDGRANDLVYALSVFAVCLFVFHRAPVQQIIDSRYLSAVSHALLHDHSAALPDNFWPSNRADRAYQLREVDGAVFHYFPAAPATLTVPIVAAYELFGVSPVSDQGRFRGNNERRILRFAAAFVAASLCLILYLLGRLFLPPGPTLGLVMAFAFGTQIFSTISRAFWSHAWAVLLMALGLYLVLASTRLPRIALMAAATALSWSFFCRPTMSLSILGISALLVVRRQKHVTLFLATGVAWAAAFVIRSVTLFGTVVPHYFSESNFQSGRSTDAIFSQYPHAVLGNLVSPGRGLLIFVPMVAWILWFVIADSKRLSARDLALTGLLVVTAHWQLISFFGNWTGGKSFGPRLLSDIVVWLFVLGALALQATLARVRASGFRACRVRFALLALTVAASVFVNTRGATSRATWNWRSFDRPPAWATSGGSPMLRPGGIWNWRHPQFMAGLLRRDEPATEKPEVSPRNPEP